MRKLNLSDITQYVEENIGTFHQKRIAGLNDLKSRLPAALTYPLRVSEYVSGQRTFTIKPAACIYSVLKLLAGFTKAAFAE